MQLDLNPLTALDALLEEGSVVTSGPTAAFALQLALRSDLVVTVPDAVTRAARDQHGTIQALFAPPGDLGCRNEGVDAGAVSA
ncbi:type 2 periplasmic-binding domain-containing protein [Streptomyces goshikiensis]|uniref:hypothetical protein n=1 Tax=Streptomyces goshikiensis TaxID=1942 RepID=UPI0036C9BFD1